MKAGWIAVALVLGVFLGVWIRYEGEETPAEPAGADARAEPGARQAAPAPATPEKSGHTKLRPGTAPSAGAGDPPATAARGQEPAYTGYQQPIDVGPVFRRHFEQEAAEGIENSMAIAHREMERELRDEFWAYPLEAQIEESLIAETSLGNFRREHVECRATLCEVRISGEGDQQETAMQNWNQGIGGQPWASSLNLNYSATIAENGQVNALLIFRKK